MYTKQEINLLRKNDLMGKKHKKVCTMFILAFTAPFLFLPL